MNSRAKFVGFQFEGTEQYHQYLKNKLAEICDPVWHACVEEICQNTGLTQAMREVSG